MKVNDIYKLIRSLKSCEKIKDEDTFYSLNENRIIQFEYTSSVDSFINLVCPKDENGDFVYIEISENGTDFTHIKNDGNAYIPLDLSTEDKFFQSSTVLDLGFSYNELIEIRMDFLKYYNGLLNTMTIFI